MKILIAEDDLASQKILKVTLENAGHEVTATSNGRLAWEAFILKPVPVIISDWMMPELDGVDLCKKIRARRSKEYTYFILLTARSDRENYLHAMDSGVDDFMAKPLRADELAIRLRVAARILNFANQVRELKRLLPICSYCKKVRDDKDYWHQIENYISKQTGTDFSHGICPECYEKHVKPQLS